MKATPTAEHLALLASGLPVALQVARRVARTTRVLPLKDLEGTARLVVTELVPGFDPDLGQWKTHVAVRVGHALCRALRKERRAHEVPAEAAMESGLSFLESLEPHRDPLAGTDAEAFHHLVEVTSEVADALAFHIDATTERTRSTLRAAIGELPAIEGRVMVLHYFEGKSFREIGRLLGCSPSEAYRAHGRALSTLRRRFKWRGG